jgi:signal transduction histidine kinase
VRLPNLIRTTSFRLTLIYAALFAVSALILFGVIYWATSHYMRNELDAAIDSDVNELREGFAAGGPTLLQQLIDERTKEMPNGPILYLFEERDGKVAAGNLPALKPQLGHFDIEVPGLLYPADRRGAIYVHGVSLADGEFLAVGADAHQLADMKRFVLRSFGWCFAIGLLLALGGGALMSNSLLRRVDGVVRASRAIMDGNLSQRIPIRGTDDEFDRLAASLNAMLDKTQASLEGMRQVSNDVAHDLRTPLTRLRQRLELVRRKPASSEELARAIDRSIIDTDAILETFGALLRIAQLEGAPSTARFATIDLSELLFTVAEVYQPMAEERRQRLIIKVAPQLETVGDRELLTQLLANVIENGIRHSPCEAAITITATHDAERIAVVIADTGPGIPAAEREKVFRRFYRLEASRTTPGNGLGLSLAAAIASLHRIAIELGDNDPGLRVSLHFPA